MTEKDMERYLYKRMITVPLNNPSIKWQKKSWELEEITWTWSSQACSLQ